MTLGKLTQQQVFMLQQLACGKRLSEIAGDLGLTRQAINGRADRLRAAIGVRTIFQMGAWAERHGIHEQQGAG